MMTQEQLEFKMNHNVFILSTLVLLMAMILYVYMDHTLRNLETSDLWKHLSIDHIMDIEYYFKQQNGFKSSVTTFRITKKWISKYHSTKLITSFNMAYTEKDTYLWS
eukprot:157244_1